MPQVIERHGHTIDDGGEIHYDDRPISWERAEEIAGHRLDRRTNYAVIDGEVCSSVQWTARCSGCSNGYETRGAGCEECGYSGVRRESIWAPNVTPETVAK